MKKIIAMLTALTMAMGIAGCGAKDESSSDETSSKADTTTAAETSSAADQASEAESSDTGSEADESSFSDSDFSDLFGYRIYCPDSFEYVTVGHPVFRTTSSTGKEYCYTYFNQIAYEPEAEPTLDDVYGYLYRDLSSYVNDAYVCLGDMKDTVESQEKIEVNGQEYLKVIGTFQTKDWDDNLTDEKYICYYSLLEYPGMTTPYGVVPTMWGAFGADVDDQTFEEMQQLVQTTAEQLRCLY